MLALLLLACTARDAASGPGEDTADTATVDDAPPPWTVPLGGCYYYRTAEVTVGAQTFHLTIDSGSTTMAVVGDGCASCDGVSARYDTSHGEATTHTASNRYDVGEMGWEGDVYRDDVAMGGVAPVNMRFAAVTDEDWMFGSFPCDSGDVPVDGILGLRQDEGAVQWTDSYLTRAVEDAGVPDAFALHLCHEGGTLWLGGYDEAETTGAVTWVPYASDTSYSVDVTAIEVVTQAGRVTVAPVSAVGGAEPGLLDSGGPHLLLPESTYDAVTAAISADPAFTALGSLAWWGGASGTTTARSPAELDATLPWLRVDLDGVQLDLPASQSYLEWEVTSTGEYAYWPNVYAYDFLDLGNLPMFGYVVVTDRTNERIGFAPAVECPG